MQLEIQAPSGIFCSLFILYPYFFILSWLLPFVLTVQHTQNTNIHAPSGIRTRNPSKPSAADPRLRPLGHCKVKAKQNLHYLVFNHEIVTVRHVTLYMVAFQRYTQRKGMNLNQYELHMANRQYILQLPSFVLGTGQCSTRR